MIGIAEKQGSAFGISLDKFAIVPYRTPAHRLVNRSRSSTASTIQSPTMQDMVSTMEVVRQTMRIAAPFAARRSRRLLDADAGRGARVLEEDPGLPRAGGRRAAGDRAPRGSIVIMNIMLVAVAERTHEIGIRKALGAKRQRHPVAVPRRVDDARRPRRAVGIAAGFGLAELIAAVSPLPAAVALWSVVVGVLVGATVGIVSGVYPATRAARLDPIAALRQE